ncbi:WbqC family protein [uncultured Pseudacidovorax sp.]|uniref:WbqC family protein n=1 Tax=uncultured Pseudacidovorax sp. TaxID=679313 RepID=UPI0025F076A0|nr:WbqC family protein [uncultured Pseudacidovorax sp.]
MSSTTGAAAGVSAPQRQGGRVGIMQPYLFPYLGYFQLLAAVDDYVVYDDAQFIKGGWINRNHILLDGASHRFSIALSQASPNRRIDEIAVADDFSRFLRTLEHAYSRAPMRDAALALVRRICSFEDRNLARFIVHSLVCIAEYLGLGTRLWLSSDIPKDGAASAQDKVLRMCEHLHAGTYINAIGGQGLYAREAFEARGIALHFLKSGECRYRQFGTAFVGGLSIIDVLMFNQPEAVRGLLQDYTLL